MVRGSAHGAMRRHVRQHWTATVLFLALALLPLASAGAQSDAPDFGGLTDIDAPEPDEIITIVGDFDLQGSTPFLPSEIIGKDTIDAFGSENVGEVLDRACRSAGGGGENGPTILINGRKPRGEGAVDIRDYPPQSIVRIEILPPEASAAYDGDTDSPCGVINVVLERNLLFRSVDARYSESGFGGRGEQAYTARIFRARGERRLFANLRAERFTALFESDRDIALPSVEDSDFFARPGNILAASGDQEDEIDPALSALFGAPVTVLGLPEDQDGTDLTLEDLVAFANQPNQQDSRTARTLLPRTRILRSYISYRDRSKPNSFLGISGTLRRRRIERENGFFQRDLPVPATNPFSPFNTDVEVAFLFEELGPLRNDDRSDFVFVNPTIARTWENWELTNSSQFEFEFDQRMQPPRLNEEAVTESLSDPDPASAFTPFGDTGTLDQDDLDRFFSDPVEIRQTRYRFETEMSLDGALFELPAGSVRQTTQFRFLRTINVNKTSDPLADTPNIRTVQTRYQGRIGLSVPLLGKDFSLPLLRRLALFASISPFAQTGASPDINYAYGATWSPWKAIEASIRRRVSVRVPDQSDLFEAVVTNDNVPIFDPVTGETAFIEVIDGGNPDLQPASLTNTEYRLRFRPSFLDGFSVQVLYTTVLGENDIAPLPPFDANTEVLFPDRVVRNETGQLVRLDRRPVNLLERRREDLNVGFDYSPPRARDKPRGAFSWRVGGQYKRRLKDTNLVSPTAPLQDLLNGETGLTGIRDVFNADLELGVRGLNARIAVEYQSDQVNRSASEDGVDVFFPSLTRATVDLRYRFGKGRLFKTPSSLDGLSLGFTVRNIFNSRRNVVDENGVTPTRFQLDYEDPLGRVFLGRARFRF